MFTWSGVLGRNAGQPPGMFGMAAKNFCNARHALWGGAAAARRLVRDQARCGEDRRRQLGQGVGSRKMMRALGASVGMGGSIPNILYRGSDRTRYPGTLSSGSLSKGH